LEFFGAIQIISCRYWLPWTKPGYITITRRQSNNQWSGGIAAHHVPKIPSAKSAGNILTSIFWDQDGILHTDYLPKGQTIKAQNYSSLLMQLKNILKVKHHGKVNKCVLFLHDNVPAQQALPTQKKQAYLAIQCLDHQPYPQDLAPLDSHLFPGLKK